MTDLGELVNRIPEYSTWNHMEKIKFFAWFLHPGKVPNQTERDFLSEALVCFQNSVFRASIVRTWNLTFFCG
jgi:hypothetical protein